MALPGRALYRAWRPRTFDEVVGQHHVVQTLRNAIRNGSLGHAYLFAGPRGTGKTTMARLLFKAVNCLDPRDGAPCDECAICVSANQGRAIDLVELDAASNRGIDDVRDLRDKIHYAPAEARFRVYILDEAHQLTQAAWDALLKTLEEPPPHAILVLATTEAHKVPATVLSRCQRFDFHRISAADTRNHLRTIAESEGLTVEPAVLTWLAQAARGGLRDAIGLLDQLRAFAGDEIDADSAREVLGLAGLEAVRPFLEALRDGNGGEALDRLNQALEKGVDLRVYLGDTLAYLRALILLRYGASTALRDELPADEIEWLEGQVVEWEAEPLRQLTTSIVDVVARTRDPGQLQLQVELAILGQGDGPAPPLTVRPRESAGESRATASMASAPAAAPSIAAERGSAHPTIPVHPDVHSQEDEPPSNLEDEADLDDLASAPQVLEPTAGTPTTAPLDFAAVRDVWPQIRGHVAASSLSLIWFGQCDLNDVDGDTLVLKLDGALRPFVDDRDRRRAVEERLTEAMGRVVRVRVSGETEARDEKSVADDPVIRAGVRLFGGPLEAVDGCT